MNDTNRIPTMDDEFDYDACTAAFVTAQEAYFRSLPPPVVPEASDEALRSWEQRHDPTL
jgi:hypothetical protein